MATLQLRHKYVFQAFTAVSEALMLEKPVQIPMLFWKDTESLFFIETLQDGFPSLVLL